MSVADPRTATVSILPSPCRDDVRSCSQRNGIIPLGFDHYPESQRRRSHSEKLLAFETTNDLKNFLRDVEKLKVKRFEFGCLSGLSSCKATIGIEDPGFLGSQASIEGILPIKC